MAPKRSGKRPYNLPDNSLFGAPEGDFHGVLDAEPAQESQLPHNKKANPAKGTADANHRGERRPPMGSEPEDREPSASRGRSSRSVLLAGLHRGVGAGARAIDPRTGLMLWPPPPAVLVDIPGAPVGSAGDGVPRRWLYVDSCFRALEVSDHGVPSLLAPSLYSPLGARTRPGRSVADVVDVQAWRLVPDGAGAGGVEYATVVAEAERAHASAMASGDDDLASLISQRFFAIAAWWVEVVVPDLAGYSLALGEGKAAA